MIIKLVKRLVVVALLVDLAIMLQMLMVENFMGAWLHSSVALWWGIVLSAGWLDEKKTS